MRRTCVQQWREGDPPPLARGDDQMIADGAERDQRPDAQGTALAGQALFHPENNHEQRNDADGQEWDIGGAAFRTEFSFERYGTAAQVGQGAWNSRSRIGAKPWALSLNGCATPTEGSCHHCPTQNRQTRIGFYGRTVCGGLSE